MRLTLLKRAIITLIDFGVDDGDGDGINYLEAGPLRGLLGFDPAELRIN